MNKVCVPNLTGLTQLCSVWDLMMELGLSSTSSRASGRGILVSATDGLSCLA